MRRLPQVLFLLGFMLWPMESRAQSEELTAAIEQGQRLTEAQSYAEAVPFFQKALSLSEREFGPDHAETVELLNSLAGLYSVLGRYAEAEPLHKRALAIQEKALGPDHPDVAVTIDGLAVVHKAQGSYSEAELFYQRAMEIREKALGPEHPDVAQSLNNLASHYDTQGRYAEAEPLHKRALAIQEKTLGREHPDVATSLASLASLYDHQGRYAEAEPLHKRALAIREKALGPEHLNVAISLNNLALLYDHQGRYAEAEPLYKRSLAIFEKVLGPEHSAVAMSLNNLASLHHNQGRYTEAEPLYKRALAIDKKAFGLNHRNVAIDLNNLAEVYRDQSRYAEAEPLYKRSLAIFEKVLGPEHPAVAKSLNNLALLYHAGGRYAEAEPLHKQALAIYEQALGPEHPAVAKSLSNLAVLYQVQGRYAEVEPLHKRSLAIKEKALGLDHPDVATSLNNLAEHYRDQGRYLEAEPLLKRSLEIKEKALGPNHPAVGKSLNNLALVYDDQDRYAEAEPLYKRALAIQERALGTEHPDVAVSLANLASLYDHQGRYAEAEPLYKRALAIKEKALGSEHLSVAISLSNLAKSYASQLRYAEAIGPIRRASAIFSDRAAQSGAGVSEQKTVRKIYFWITLGLLGQNPSQRPALTAEMFEVGQLAQTAGATGAIARMAARFGAGNDALASIARTRQDAVKQWQRLDKALIAALSQTPNKRDPSKESQLRADLADLDRRIAALDEQLTRDFPDYAELATPRPLQLADAQNLLAEDEALMAYAVESAGILLWVIRGHPAQMDLIAIGGEDLGTHVQSLRRTLDPHTKLRPFDIPLAHDLYQELFAPAEPLLEGVKHVFLVPDGALQSLPFGVLVTEEVDADLSDSSGYREVPWLARKYAITTLPSVSSLRALRQYAKTSKADEPFFGVGDPLLSGHPSTAPKIELSGLFSLRGIGDVEAVRSLPSLPETANELEALAYNLKASPDSLLLREEATEPNLRSIDLERYRVLAFATHAIVAGELKGLAEPALVLTPPDVGTEEDDGLLTASEVASLKLDADWVILSACNTAAPDGTPGAEALSGLAKAFFYAGSRALLVSHWPVSSEAAVALTTRMLTEYANDPGIGRAEALRRSMMALLMEHEDPRFAHPFYWAPFVVVGEGGVPADRAISVQ